jgi:hypothetical protein
MKRLQIIQEIFKSTVFKTYLEIGCYRGKTFFPVKAKRKIAVDPYFHVLFMKDALLWSLKEIGNIRNKYFQLESDVFFKKKKAFLNKVKPIDVVLIDGLHTFKTSLNDVVNSLSYLNEKGLIIMHDCYPPNKAAAITTKHFPTLEEQSNEESWSGAWCGDVWKTIVYLQRSHSQLLDVCVINSDNGLGIVRFKQGVKSKCITINQNLFSEINGLTYDDLIQDVENLLNLKPSDYAFELIDSIILNNTTKK